MFRKLKKGDIVETPTGERAVVANAALPTDYDVEVKFSDGGTCVYDRDELVRIDTVYKIIDKICNWLGV